MSSDQVPTKFASHRQNSTAAQEKEALINAYEAEEESIVATLTKALEAERASKIQLSQQLESESEAAVNRMARRLSSSSASTNNNFNDNRVRELEETIIRERAQADLWRRELISWREKASLSIDDVKDPLGLPHSPHSNASFTGRSHSSSVIPPLGMPPPRSRSRSRDSSQHNVSMSPRLPGYSGSKRTFSGGRVAETGFLKRRESNLSDSAEKDMDSAIAD